jgi:hypothetical protein
MATLATTHPTMADVAKALGPDGKVEQNLVEILNQNNEVLDDMVMLEGNLPTGHRHTIRSGLPAPTWRKLYGGVQPTKSTTVQVTDQTGMLEAYAEIDKALADLNGNASAYRLQQDRAHIEGMSEEAAQTLFYGNEGTAPEEFTGLAPRFSSLSAQNADNIIDAGGTGTDNMSIWLVVWGPGKVWGLYPKGSKIGLQMEDKGQVTLEAAPDGSGGRMEAYRTHYRWDLGLAVADWRYVVRIANIDSSDLTYNAATGAKLVDLMTQALELVPNTNGRPVFYVNRRIRSFIRRQGVQTANVMLRLDEISGRHVTEFDGIPVKRVDQLLATEARVV